MQKNNMFQLYIENRKKQLVPVILICGYTGSGKSTLIQSVFGKNIVPDNKISNGEPKTQCFTEYKNEVIKIFDSKGLEPEKEQGIDSFLEITQSFIKKKKYNEDVNEHINVYWYVIQGQGARVTASDIKIIKSFPQESTIVIISKKDITKPIQMKSMKNKLVEAGIKEEMIIEVSEPKSESGMGEGILELCQKTYKILPEAYKTTFQEAQQVELEKAINAIKIKRLHAKSIIIEASNNASKRASLTPFPVLDTVAASFVRDSMIAKLATLYKINLTEQQCHKLTSQLDYVNGERLFGTFSKGLIPGGIIIGGIMSGRFEKRHTLGLGIFIRNHFEEYALSKIGSAEKLEINMQEWDFEAFMKTKSKILGLAPLTFDLI